MFPKRTLARTLLLLAVMCLAIAVLLWLSVQNTKKAAARFLSDFARVEIGSSGIAATRTLANAYPDAVRSEQRSLGTNSLDCRQGDCNLAFLFENGWLRRLKVAAPVWIRANVFVENGVVTHKHFEMGCGRGPTHFLVSVSEAANGAQPYSSTDRRSGDTDWRIGVELTSQASKEQRDRAYAINVNRLAELRACKDVSELLTSAIAPQE